MAHNVSAEVKIKKMKKPCYSQQSQIKMQQNLQDILCSIYSETKSNGTPTKHKFCKMSSPDCDILTTLEMYLVSVELVTRAAESSFTNLYTMVQYSKHIHTLNHLVKIEDSPFLYSMLQLYLCLNENRDFFSPLSLAKETRLSDFLVYKDFLFYKQLLK